MKTFAIVLSAGSSTRFGGNTKKQYYEINGKPVLFYSLNAFNKSNCIDEIVLVTAKDYLEIAKQYVKNYSFKKVKHIIVGGSTRQESVKCGLDSINEDDAARPLVDEEIISSLVEALDKYDGASPAIPVYDTIIKVENNELSSYEDRDTLYRIQTPQAFRLSVIKEAHEKFQGKNASDDTQLTKLLGKKIKITKGKEQLMKLTKLEDTDAIEAYIIKNEHLQN